MNENWLLLRPYLIALRADMCAGPITVISLSSGLHGGRGRDGLDYLWIRTVRRKKPGAGSTQSTNYQYNRNPPVRGNNASNSIMMKMMMIWWCKRTKRSTWEVRTFTLLIPCIIIQLLQFEPTNAHSFTKITVILQHTNCYTIWAWLAQHHWAHNCLYRTVD